MIPETALTFTIPDCYKESPAVSSTKPLPGGG
jgi:hypothetical protein